MKNDLHVVPNSGSWSVKREKNPISIGNFRTQSDASDFAKALGKIDRCEVVIHRRNGRIRDKDSYGNDPCPPRDNKH